MSSQYRLPNITCCTFFYSFLGLISATSDAQTLKYTYDALGRVTFVEDSVNGNRDYDYDPAGNRVAVNVGNATEDPAPVPLLPAPTAANCRSVGAGGWFATWNAVAGAHHYQFRKGNEQEITVTINNSGSNSSCKWVKACDAANVCSTKTLFFPPESPEPPTPPTPPTPPAPSTPPPAPTNAICRSVGGGGWFATWNAVAGAHHYQFRKGNEQEITVTINNSGSNSSCKWVKACDANNVCSENTLF
jgi:hypothetical protein